MYAISQRYGSQVRSRTAGKTWITGYSTKDGKSKSAGTHPTEDLAAHALAK